MSVNIHGKEYITVAERVEMSGEDFIALNTEVLQHTPIVVVKATVMTKKGTFTGISAANPLKAIEKASPYEVAETSAVGRALGFAGYGIVNGIATADEIKKVDTDADWIKGTDKDIVAVAKDIKEDIGDTAPLDRSHCPVHNVKMSKFSKNGKSWYSHSVEGKWCNGNG